MNAIIYVGHVSNINGSGYTATFGEPDETSFRGTFHRTPKAATKTAIEMRDEAKMIEGRTYEIVGPFAVSGLLRAN